MSISTIAVVAKECLPGRVKTRLTPPLTPEHAARVARASLDATLDAVRLADPDRRLLLFDGRPPVTARDFDVLPQRPGGLDERLGALFDAVDGPLLLIGMDTPQVDPDVLRAALGDPSDACLGAAADGGFWALGMRAPRGDLIRGVPMSTPWTGAAQRARLIDARLSVRELPVLEDVDDIDSAERVAALLPGSRFAAALEAEVAA